MSSFVDSTISDDSGVAPTIAWSGPVGAPLKITNGSTADPTVLFAKRGTYRLTVTATDAGTPPLATTKTIDVAVNAAVFSIAGKVLDNDVPTSPATGVQLTWLPLTSVIATMNTSTIDGSFSFADLVGQPTDFQVTVPGKP
ncbi:hypothetical protein LBMAG53_40080 [Planctomycetota bacterium]|nr:hypothetical protein LBMAG53_40080 [Planctomycetota bacterium]